MEEKFLQALEAARKKAETLGVRIRPLTDMKAVQRVLTGHRESDGFWQLTEMGKGDLTLEALALKKEFSALFTDEMANTALARLLEAGHKFY